jgi:hypothetical protein
MDRWMEASPGIGSWGSPVAEEEWAWASADIERGVDFSPKSGRFVIFQRLASIGGWASVGEVWVYTPGSALRIPAPQFSHTEGTYLNPLRLTINHPSSLRSGDMVHRRWY